MHWHMFLTMYCVNPPIEIIPLQDGQRNRSQEVAWWSMGLLAIWKGHIYLWSWVCVFSQRRERIGSNSLTWRHLLSRDKEGENQLSVLFMGVVMQGGGRREHELFSLNDGHPAESCKIYCFCLIIYVILTHCGKYGKVQGSHPESYHPQATMGGILMYILLVICTSF